MAVYQIKNIIRDVRIAIDQNTTSAGLTGIGDIETLSLDEIIRSKIVESVKRVHCLAPLRMLNLGHNFGNKIVDPMPTVEPAPGPESKPQEEFVYWKEKEQGVGYILLPNNFMRLVVFMMSDWERPVYSALDMEDSNSVKQYSRFKGVRGTPQKPKCVLTMQPEGRVLEFYSCKDNTAKVSRGVYIPYPAIELASGEEGIQISNQCYDAVIYTIAGLTAAAFGDVERSKLFNELAESLLK